MGGFFCYEKLGFLLQSALYKAISISWIVYQYKHKVKIRHQNEKDPTYFMLRFKIWNIKNCIQTIKQPKMLVRFLSIYVFNFLLIKWPYPTCILYLLF